MSEKYADIIIDISHEKLDRVFQYKIPDAFAESLKPGMCVEIPFGSANRMIKGYCVGISEQTQYAPEKIKDIHKIGYGEANVEDKLMQLAGWIRMQYGSTMIAAIKTVMPARKAVKQLEHRTITLAIEKEEAISLLGICERKKQVAKGRLLQELIAQPSMPYEQATRALKVSAATIGALSRDGVIRVDSTLSYRNPVTLTKEGTPRHTLSEEQQTIIDTVMDDFDSAKRGTYLIHGITGSGKTEVYIKLIEAVVQRKKQAIVLIPEIALTYQTLHRFYKRFGDRVSVLNSTLSPGEKYDQCERAKQGELDVIIGPRSALFTPFPDIGLIIIDEEHENSYKSESTPKYHARETAMELARLHNASVVLGSATPSLEAYYRAKTGQYRLFTLKERLTGGSLPAVEIVDLRKELKEGNRSIFSRRLMELLIDRLNKGQQCMLFLNRRGYASFISCRSCGHVMKCPHCDVSLSEHKGGRLYCHYCGYSEPKPARCPECGSKYIMGFRAGTQQIEEKLKEALPGIRTLRMDRDTTATKDSYEKILTAFGNGEADVLIGTQMIVKGHDFPNVTLVGVLAADLSLHGGDFRAGEKTFDLLVQAVGRAGRGSIPGNAVIQTYAPDHYAVKCAANQDYESFYQEEILYRELGGYPPASHMLAVQIYAMSEECGEALANRLSDMVKWNIRQKNEKGISILGPAKAGIGKINDVYRQVFYMKCNTYDRLVEQKDLLEEYLKDNGRTDVTVQFDFDPVNML